LLGRLNDKQLKTIAAQGMNNDDRRDCLNIASRDDNVVINKKCTAIKKPSGSLGTILFWGDSHLETLRAPFLTHRQSNNFELQFSGVAGCPPIPGIERNSKSKKCSLYSHKVLEYIQSNKNIKTVVLGARFATYVYGNTSYLGTAEGGKHKYVSSFDKELLTDRERFNAIKKHLSLLVERLVGSDVNIIIIGSIPEYGVRVPRELFRLQFEVDEGKKDIAIDRKVVMARSSALDAMLIDIANKYKRVQFVDPKNKLCNQRLCFGTQQSIPIYFDDDHLNHLGAELVYPMLLDAINKTVK